jgi:NADH:ubiquinone oxidoreductase subunit 5 (subunit L)/multisubunit Na+/H+ antiporter MnhA subunit
MTLETTLIILIVLLPMAVLPLLAMAGKKLKGETAWPALVFPLISAAGILKLWSMSNGEPLLIKIPWIPMLDIHLSFLIDGLSVFFGLVVSVVGAFIVFYARQYLGARAEHAGRFYTYLIFFMASMLGTVLADDLMMLFVFWELTGISSFLLIGFFYFSPVSQVGARQALLVTVGTGLLMLLGLIILYSVAGTWSFSELMALDISALASPGIIDVVLVFLLLGAFGKSAQFPFHFWLPNAMAAPTPVSAYLHSATMVKLGVFLAARIYPLFCQTALWGPLLLIFGFLTMVLGAVLALRSWDLKAILAFSTVSQLGFLMGFYGLDRMGVEHDLYHIANHVLYKGSLFMVAGIVDHSVGTRDIRKLGGLFSYMPLAGIAFLICAASMAGIPGTTGFVSKELMLDKVWQLASQQGGLAWLLPLGMLISAVCLTAFSIRLFVKTFTGVVPKELKSHLHAPSVWFQLPPFILAIGVLLFGFWPAYAGGMLESLNSPGLHQNEFSHLAVFHGFNPALAMSITAWVGGFFIYRRFFHHQVLWQGIPKWIKFDSAFEYLVENFGYFCKKVSAAIRTDKPMDYLYIIVAFSVILLGQQIFGSFITADLVLPSLTPLHVVDGLVIVLICGAVLAVIFPKRWTTRLIALSVTGFLICFYFVLNQAPDLALTQMLVESAVLILMLILLGRFPKSAEENEMADTGITWRKGVAAVLGTGCGIIVAVSIWVVTNDPHPNPIGPYFTQNTIELAKGANAVNTILVDFRGFDTMGEITVLAIALVGGLALFMRWKEPKK